MLAFVHSKQIDLKISCKFNTQHSNRFDSHLDKLWLSVLLELSLLLSCKRWRGGSFVKNGWRSAWSIKRKKIIRKWLDETWLVTHLKWFSSMDRSRACDESGQTVANDPEFQTWHSGEGVYNDHEHIGLPMTFHPNPIFRDRNTSSWFFCEFEWRNFNEIPKTKNYFKWCYLAILYGTVPRILSIIAKCSRLSCVWKSVMPR